MSLTSRPYRECLFHTPASPRFSVEFGTRFLPPRGRWMAAGGYEPVAEKLFNLMPVDAIFLEYDSERAGGFEPLRFVPKDKRVVVGLVSSKAAALEDQSNLLRRIEAASNFVPLDELALSTQCGFASVAGGNLLTEGEQWAKLDLVVSTAHKVWGTST